MKLRPTARFGTHLTSYNPFPFGIAQLFAPAVGLAHRCRPLAYPSQLSQRPAVILTYVITTLSISYTCWYLPFQRYLKHLLNIFLGIHVSRRYLCA
ncbi:hypothetical protein F4859DRAFT_469082 [Xylaria cf. heliscus]|nr:hypothetical protein F4859DRAFT_469082 [Xylaria cf. heliscus]